MAPTHDITKKMKDFTIKPKAPVSTPNHTIMESTHEITQEMEDMTLNPKARVDTPFTTTTSPHTQRVPRQRQPQPSLPAAFNFAGNSTGDYVYTTTSAGLSFSNPNASSSSSNTTTSSTTDTTNITTNTAATNLFQDQDFCDHLLNCDDPVGFLEVSLYLARFPSMSLSHNHPSSNNRITKSRSTTTTSSSRERHHLAHPIRLMQPGLMSPEMGTTIYKATMKKVPGTTIYTTTAERKAAEEKEKEKQRMTTAYIENCLTLTKARAAAEKAARVARERQRQMQMRSGGSGMGGADGEDSSWFLRGRERAKKTWVNEDGDVVEERWLEPNPMVSWREGSEGFDEMDGVEESAEDGDEDDEMME